jgi:hypothetical protein
MLAVKNKFTQSEIDNYLFNDLNSSNPLLSTDETLLYIHIENQYITLERSNLVSKDSKKYETYIYKSNKLQYLVKIYGKSIKNQYLNERKAVIEVVSQSQLNNKVCNFLRARIIESSMKFAVLTPVPVYNLSKYDTHDICLKDKITILSSIRSQMEEIIKLNKESAIFDPDQTGFSFAYFNISHSNIEIRDENGYKASFIDVENLIGHDVTEFPGEFNSIYPIPYNNNKNNVEYTQLPNRQIVKGMRYAFGLFAYFFVYNKHIRTKPIKQSRLLHWNRKLLKFLGKDYSDLIIDESNFRSSMY